MKKFYLDVSLYSNIEILNNSFGEVNFYISLNIWDKEKIIWKYYLSWLNTINKLIHKNFDNKSWDSESETKVYSGLFQDGKTIGNLKFLTCQEWLNLIKLLISHQDMIIILILEVNFITIFLVVQSYRNYSRICKQYLYGDSKAEQLLIL